MVSKILPVEQIVGYILNENNTDFWGCSPTNEVSYSWGDQQELTAWILAKDNEISGMRAFGKANKSKYPLIFMVAPLDGEILHSENYFRGITFIVCCDTQAEWLNSTRENKTMPMLTNLANKLIEILSKSKYSEIIKENGTPKVTYRKIYNYPLSNVRNFAQVSKQNETIDIWDAITLKFDLKINNNCLNNLELCQ